MTDGADGVRWRERLEASVQRSIDRGRALWAGAVSVVPALDLLTELGARFRRLNGSVLVGHVAYRLFLWLIPLLLVAIGLLGYGVAEGIDIVRYGQDAGLDEELLQTTGDTSDESWVQILLVALFGLAWTTRGLLRALYFVYAQAWRVAPRLPQRTMRAVGLTLVGALVGLAVAAVVNVLAGRGPLLALGSSVAGAATAAGVLLFMSWFLPHRAPSVLDLVPGVAVAVTGMTAMSALGGLYFPRRLSEASETYGTIGFTLVFLFYLWLWAFLVVGAAFVNAVWCDREEILAGRPPVAAPELLPGWLRRLVVRLPGVGLSDGARDGPNAVDGEPEQSS